MGRIDALSIIAYVDCLSWASSVGTLVAISHWRVSARADALMGAKEKTRLNTGNVAIARLAPHMFYRDSLSISQKKRGRLVDLR